MYSVLPEKQGNYYVLVTSSDKQILEMIQDILNESMVGRETLHVWEVADDRYELRLRFVRIPTEHTRLVKLAASATAFAKGFRRGHLVGGLRERMLCTTGLTQTVAGFRVTVRFRDIHCIASVDGFELPQRFSDEEQAFGFVAVRADLIGPWVAACRDAQSLISGGAVSCVEQS